MAPVASTVALSHVEGVSDAARARELYKYYQPSEAAAKLDECFVASSSEIGLEENKDTNSQKDINISSEVTSSKVSSPDTALTAFCQLVTWRTGAQRAMISFIDDETQYFVAESTKTVDLNDNTKHALGDGIWMGCSTVTKAGRLCERTIAVTPTSDNDYPCFIVDDLSKDDRFNTLPFVAESPFLRFYAGVPLITKRRIPIGSLFIVDDRVGNGMSQENINFMGTMAETIMKHMEMVREVEEHRRGMKMSHGLASFVEGKAELIEGEADAEDGEGTKIAGQFETDSGISRTRSNRGSTRDSVQSVVGSGASQATTEREYSIALSRTEEGIQRDHEHDTYSQMTRPELESGSQLNSFGGTSVSVSSPHGTLGKALPPLGDESEASVMRNLFSRAANLIREAFEVDGGAVFFDAQTGFSTEVNRKSDDGSQSGRDGDDSHAESLDTTPVDDLSPDEGSSAEQPSDGEKFVRFPRGDLSSEAEQGLRYSRTTKRNKKRSEILGFSTPGASSINGDNLPEKTVFSTFGEHALETLLLRYPRGKMWTFGSDGAISLSAEENTAKDLPSDPNQRIHESHKRKLRSVRAKEDAKFLYRHFPGVHQLLFVPLWDAGRSRWLSGCMVWSTEPTRILSKQSELAFLTAFGNSVMAEWARIDTEIADQKKGDFIGSVSHELRSPLHGILASAEFLSEVTDGWEQQLVETIDSCGRTLLDTINHILDFSKINHFEKNWRKSKRAGNRLPGGGPLSMRSSDIPMLNLFQEVDVSTICEEVVESVFAGHVFQNFTARTFDEVAGSRGKMADKRKVIQDSEQMMGPQKLHTAGVDVILDINPHKYQFITQPGALRRLIMNLLGNSLKYTSHGYVKIKLDATDMEALKTTTSSGAGSGSGSDEQLLRSRVTLSVTDTGKGISSDFLRSKLFMPFAQENSLSSGTGLGLSIVRKIVTLLEGDITIDSEVGRGTQVRVSLPLLREMPKMSESSGSTPKSNISAPKDAAEAIHILRTRIQGQKFALHGFNSITHDPVVNESIVALRKSVTKFLVEWFGMKAVPLGTRCNLIITNEASPDTITQLIRQAGTLQKNHPAIIVLCSYSSTFDRKFQEDNTQCHVGYVAKPIGPLKLARAITNCIDGQPCLPTPRGEAMSPKGTDLSKGFEELSLGRGGNEILDNSRMAADSENARKAIESPTPSAAVEQTKEFPFPSSPPALPKSKTITANECSLADKAPLTASPIIPPPSSSKTGEPTPATIPKSLPPPAPAPKPAPLPPISRPTMLLVDDNAINLKLLSSYFTRSKSPYETVHQAVHGLEAVQRVEARPEGYDIIFMDITMPILDGFGATRQIRALEKKRRRDALPDVRKSESLEVETEVEPVLFSGAEDEDEKKKRRREEGGALIIAFTGRSSIEDQIESVRSGVDLFLTKPVAFREVGKIVKNWLGNTHREDAQEIVSTDKSGDKGKGKQ